MGAAARRNENFTIIFDSKSIVTSIIFLIIYKVEWRVNLIKYKISIRRLTLLGAQAMIS